MRETVDIAALNSRVKFDRTDVPFDQRAILGDATETGLVRFAGRYLPDFDEHLKKHPKVFEIPFNSTNKWALTIVRHVVILLCLCLSDVTSLGSSISHTRKAC
jgi:sodium/potassium-transporting ATPase subunit alpha